MKRIAALAGIIYKIAIISILETETSGPRETCLSIWKFTNVTMVGSKLSGNEWKKRDWELTNHFKRQSPILITYSNISRLEIYIT